MQTPSLGQKGTKNRILPSSITPLTLPDSRTRGLVVCGDGVVDVNKDTGIASLVRAGEADERRRAAAATVVDLDLRAGDVELGTAWVGGSVDGDVLGTEKVVAGRERLGNGESKGVAVLGWEGDLAAAEGRAELGDLEPGRAAVCAAGGGDFRHVKSW